MAVFPWRDKGSDAKKASGASQVTCQRCLEKGHYTYQCKNEAAYVSKTSRSKELRRNKKRKLLSSSEVPDEFRSKSELAIIEKEREEARLAAKAADAAQQDAAKAKKTKKAKKDAGSDTSSYSSSSSDSYTSSSSSYTSSDSSHSSASSDSSDADD